MSILLLYRRIFTTVNRVFVIGLHTIMIYTTAWFLTTLLLCIFQCTPISFFWRQVLPEPPQGHCIPLVPAQVSMNILNTIGDIATLILPGLALWKLQMSTGKKVAVAAIFLIGILYDPRKKPMTCIPRLTRLLQCSCGGCCPHIHGL